jgi:hypothetical protein
MEFPILIKEIRVTLRRREAFFSAFIFYAILTSVITFQWIVIREDPGFFLYREWAARLLFFGVLGFGFTLFCLHAGLSAARILVLERERKSEALVRTAPVPAWRFLVQKLLSPFFVEWLFFLGILPVLSLIFLLGGVSPNEYAYQMTNLAVWLNTSIVVGLWISAGAKTTGKARSKTIGMLLLLALLLPFLASVCIGVSLGLQNVGNLVGYKQFLKETVDFLAVVCWPLITLTPIWMVASWYSDMAGVGTIFTYYGSTSFPECPALLPWMILTGLQILLFLATIRRWRRTRDEADTATSLKEARSALGFFRWLRRGRAVRKPHPTTWGAFFKQEDYEVFKKGPLTKVLFAACYLLFFLFLYAFIQSVDSGGWGGVRAFAYSILPIAGAIALLSALGFANNAMRREKDRDCGVFLLTSPIEERSVLFGKWLYYQWFAIRILGLGTIVFLLWYRAAYSAASGYSPGGGNLAYWLALPLMLAWVPLLSLLGIYQGLRSRFRSGVMRLLVPILILWLGGGFLTLALSTLEGVTEWRTFWRVFEWVFYDALSPLVLLTAAAVSIGVRKLLPNTDRPNPLWRILFGGLWVSFALVDILLGQNEKSSILVFGERMSFGEARLWLRWYILPLGVTWLIWAFIATRSREWWRKRLTSLETVS